MENEKKIGGKRKGAGRKPVLNKKKQVSLYIESGKILKFGNEEKMKMQLYKFIDQYNNISLLQKSIEVVEEKVVDYNPMFRTQETETEKILNLSYFVSTMSELDKNDKDAILKLKEEVERSQLTPIQKRDIIYSLQTGNY